MAKQPRKAKQTETPVVDQQMPELADVVSTVEPTEQPKSMEMEWASDKTPRGPIVEDLGGITRITY